MSTTRKRYSAEFKAKLALEVVKGNHTLACGVATSPLFPYRKDLSTCLPFSIGTAASC